MELLEHLRTTGTALKRWFIAQSLDALAVGAIWPVEESPTLGQW